MARFLELGSYIAPAYAGMILAEQGHEVVKVLAPPPTQDPILGLRQGEQLWDWICHKKTLIHMHATEIPSLLETGKFDGVIDNFRPQALTRWGLDLEFLAEEHMVGWVSIRSDFEGERSFDKIAQARALGDIGHLDFYLGDTSIGLWAAFKLLSSGSGHNIIYQASALRKLVEGELMVRPEDTENRWDPPGAFGISGGAARVVFRGEDLREPVRDWDWMVENLRHQGGRIII